MKKNIISIIKKAGNKINEAFRLLHSVGHGALLQITTLMVLASRPTGVFAAIQNENGANKGLGKILGYVGWGLGIFGLFEVVVNGVKIAQAINDGEGKQAKDSIMKVAVGIVFMLSTVIMQALVTAFGYDITISTN